MLDYVRTTPPLPIQCQELAKRMLSLPNNIPEEVHDENSESLQYKKCDNIKSDDISNNIKNDDEINHKKIHEKKKSQLHVSGHSRNHEVQDLLPSTALTQLTVNEYLAGQGIAQHIGPSSTRLEYYCL